MYKCVYSCSRQTNLLNHSTQIITIPCSWLHLMIQGQVARESLFHLRTLQLTVYDMFREENSKGYEETYQTHTDIYRIHYAKQHPYHSRLSSSRSSPSPNTCSVVFLSFLSSLFTMSPVPLAPLPVRAIPSSSKSSPVSSEYAYLRKIYTKITNTNISTSAKI